MSVKGEEIDFNKVFEKSTGVSKAPGGKPVPKKEDDGIDFNKVFQNSVKKKDTGEPSATGSEDAPDGAAPGTTSTTKPEPIKWEDNPLNPVKAANEFEAKRDKIPELLFKEGDKQKLNSLVAKHNVAPAAPVTKPLSWIEDPGQTLVKPGVKPAMQVEYETALNLEAKLKSDIDFLKQTRVEKREPKSKAEKELETELQEAQVLKRKAFMEMAENGDKEVVVLSRQDDSGNSFKRTMQEMFGNKPGAWQTEKPKIEDKLAKLPTQFMTGLNVLKGIEPAEYERVTDAITNGLPISQSQTAKITNLGLSLEGAKLQRDILKSPVTKAERETVAEINKELETVKTDIEKYEIMIKGKQPLSPEQKLDYESKIKQYNATATKYKPLIEKVNTIDGAFAKRAKDIEEARRKNLVDNPEVLRSFISDGVANKLDELGKDNPMSKKRPIGTFLAGHTWSYSPEQIKWAAEEYLKEEGIDPTTPQAQSAIKYLQDNEGVMIGENSIAKAGGIREFGAGFVEPLEGVSKFLDSKTRSLNDIYAESQSEGNVKVNRKRLESEEKGVRGVMNEVLKGTGQFISQAAMMAATSGAVGTVAKSIMGRSGVQLLADAKAAGIKPVIAFDDATANIAAGKFLTSIKDPVAVFTTSYAMSYDGNLKAALSYTSDNELAKRAASFNASMEGATELFLSPLDIARGIYSKFSKSQTKDLLQILSDKSLKNDPSKLKEYVGRFVKGVLGTAKVSGAEIGEEYVTQISDYVTNLYLNPESDSFKNRDLAKELMTTTYQTGLSMALPALLNGIGAARANSFSKGSLMVAAQNRQAMIDDLNKSAAQGTISQDYANQQIQLINTAAVANSQLPKKANGADLNTDEKANYIWSRVTEAYMDKNVSSTTDAAEKEIWKDKILQQQDYRKQILGLKDEQPEAPEYTIDGKPVGKEEFLATAEKEPEDHTFEVSGDEETREIIRKIGGIDSETDSEVTSAVIEIDGKVYEGKNHAEAILKAKAEGKDISKVDRKRQGKFKLADGTVIDRAEAKKRFGQDRSELLIEQDEAADAANKEYRKSDKDLVTEIQDKGVPGYEKTSIKELKEQSLGAPASFKTHFDDEELTVDLISRNTEEQIENAIAYQQERLQASGIDEVTVKEIDRHIKLLELGLERNKEIAEAELVEEEKPAEKSEGQPLSKIDQLAAKKFLDKEDVPGETIDDKLRYISEQPEGTFGEKLTGLAEKRFPKQAPAETQKISENKKQIHSEFNKETGINTVLVGSVSRNEAKEKSDIDIVLEGMPHTGKEKLNSEERQENSNYAYDTLKHLAEKGVVTNFQLKDNGFGLTFEYKGHEFQVVPNPSAKAKTKTVSSAAPTEVKGKDVAEIEKIEKEIESLEPRYNELVDIVNKQDRKLLDEPTKEAIEAKELQKQINDLVDKKKELQQSGEIPEEKKENKNKLSAALDEIGYPSTNPNLENLSETIKARLYDAKGVITIVPFKDVYVVAEGGYGTDELVRPFSDISSYEIGFNFYTTYFLVQPKNIPALKESIKKGGRFGPKSFVETNKDFKVIEIYDAPTPNKNEQNEQSAKKQQPSSKETGGSSTKSGKSVKPEKIKTFKKRAKATIKSPLYLKALEIESQEPRVLALQYFIAGGRIHRQALEKLFGGNKLSGRKNVEAEIKAHFQLQGKHGARSIDQLAHDLWDETDEIAQAKFDSQDFSNAVEAVLLDHSSRATMAEELVKQQATPEENEWQKYYDQAFENLDENEQQEVDKAINILEGMTDAEIQQMLDAEQEALADDAYLEQLSNLYDNPKSPAEIEQAEKNKKIAEIEKEKQAQINKATKPNIQPEQTGLSIEDLAATTEANRQQHTDIKQKMYSLRELINCLWA